MQKGNIQGLNQTNIRNVLFGIVLLILQIIVGFVYGFLVGYHPEIQKQSAQGDPILVAILIILALGGFGLLNTYITNASFLGLAGSILLFAITIQHYILIKIICFESGVYRSLQDQETQYSSEQFNKITFGGIYQNNLLTSYKKLQYFALTDTISCGICIILIFSPLVGRINFLSMVLLSLFGTLFYQFNAQILIKFSIFDSGYGMRIFLFAGTLGLITPLFIRNAKQISANHKGYYSSYESRSLALLGFVISFCAFPFLCISNLYHKTQNDSKIIYRVMINMYFALGTGVLGSYVSSILSYRKLSIFDLLFTGLGGGISLSSCSNLYSNPGIAIIVGFLTGLLCSWNQTKFFRILNKAQINYSLPVISRLVIPGMITSILSAILFALENGPYAKQSLLNRSGVSQGCYQILGMILTMSIGAAGSLVLGILLRLNRIQIHELYNDFGYFVTDRLQSKTGVPKSWEDTE